MATPVPTSATQPTTRTTQATPPVPRAAQMAVELLFSASMSFCLTYTLLLVLARPVSTLLVLRVTGVCTLLVFAALEALVGSRWDVVGSRWDGHRALEGGEPGGMRENPEFKIRPRGVRAREVEAGAGAGWPSEKGAMMV